MITIKFDAKHLQNKLNSINKNLKPNINNGVNHSGIILKEEVQASILGQRAEPRSYKTGAFHNSITAEGSNQFQSQVKSDVEYSKFLEYGTSRIEERRHFRNSLARKNADILKEIVGEVNKTLNTI